MAEEKEKANTTPSSTSGTSSTTSPKSTSSEATASSNKNALVYSDEQIAAMVQKQQDSDKRTAAIEKAGFDISDDELPENITPEVEQFKLPEGVQGVVNLNPAMFGVTQKTEGLDKTIPGGKYVVVRGNRAYYVNANGEEITEDGKLINPRPEVNMVNMATPARQ